MVIREVIVRELEASYERSDHPIYWRLDNQGRAERGYDSGQYTIWTLVHPLSTFLLDQRKLEIEECDSEIPY